VVGCWFIFTLLVDGFNDETGRSDTHDVDLRHNFVTLVSQVQRRAGGGGTPGRPVDWTTTNSLPARCGVRAECEQAGLMRYCFARSEALSGAADV